MVFSLGFRVRPPGEAPLLFVWVSDLVVVCSCVASSKIPGMHYFR